MPRAMWTVGSHVVLAIAWSATLGCTGSIGSAGENGPPASRGAGGATGGAGIAIGGGAGHTPGGSTPPPKSSFIDPAARALVRLTNAEYSQTVSDLLGEPQDAAARHHFPEDARAHGFDNNVDLLRVSTAHAEQYAAAASAIARATFATAQRRALVLSCDPAAAGPCLSTYVRALGRRMFRRGLADAEVGAYVTVGQKAALPSDPNAGPEVILEAMLQSPNFLCRSFWRGTAAVR